VQFDPTRRVMVSNWRTRSFYNELPLTMGLFVSAPNISAPPPFFITSLGGKRRARINHTIVRDDEPQSQLLLFLCNYRRSTFDNSAALLIAQADTGMVMVPRDSVVDKCLVYMSNTRDKMPALPAWDLSSPIERMVLETTIRMVPVKMFRKYIQRFDAIWMGATTTLQQLLDTTTVYFQPTRPVHNSSPQDLLCDDSDTDEGDVPHGDLLGALGCGAPSDDALPRHITYQYGPQLHERGHHISATFTFQFMELASD